MSILLTINELANLKKISNIVAAAKSIQVLDATKKDVNKAIELLHKHIDRNQHHKAVATALALILWNPNDAIKKIRRKGILRSSRYDFRSSGIETVIDASLELIKCVYTGNTKVHASNMQYLYSVKDLLVVAHDVRSLRRRLIQRLRTRQKIVLKTLLVIVNQCFTKGWINNPETPSDKLEHWSSEDIAEAFSYLLRLTREELKTEKGWIHVDTSVGDIFTLTYTDLLVSAAKINAYLEVETLIDGLPYKATIQENELHVSAFESLFEKSVRLGYIQADNQRNIRISRFYEEFKSGNNTFNKFITDAFNAGLGKLAPIVNKPLERLVFSIPNDEQFLYPITHESFYIEELPSLIGIAIDSFLQEGESPISIPVSSELTVEDLIKVQRLFGFINAVFENKLETIDDEQYRNELMMRSVIPVIEHKNLLSLLSSVLSPKKAENVIALLTLKEDESHIDVQYKPLIKNGDYYVFSPALIHRSNLIRNVVVANNLRSLQVKEVDPLQREVAKALETAGFLVQESFEFNISGKTRETDIFCWRDGCFFILECKNPYHPCNSHELRNSYEHIKKAEKQLDIRIDWLKNQQNQRKLFDALGWNVATTQDIYTCIVSGNRLLNGFKSGLHPIRQGHELINVLVRGTFQLGEQEHSSFWKDKTFGVDDLLTYLNGKSVISMQFDKLRPYQESIKYKTTSIEIHRYAMDITELSPPNPRMDQHLSEKAID
ncbi:hypothetical protein RGL49_002421 [Vibrio parahaemolyticus]|nr:hypothetical protein [Vibrio parahaemolyticus]